MNEEESKPLLSNKVYNVLKQLAVIILPAFGAFYYALAGVWGLPGAEEVVASVVATETFLGVIIKLGDASYNASEARFDGELAVASNGDGTGTVNLDLKQNNPEVLANEKGEVVLKVVPEVGSTRA